MHAESYREKLALRIIPKISCETCYVIIFIGSLLGFV
jgi:hypothetical protein